MWQGRTSGRCIYIGIGEVLRSPLVINFRNFVLRLDSLLLLSIYLLLYPVQVKRILLVFTDVYKSLFISEGIVDLKNLVDNAQKLPNIPKVVQELIESFGNE